MHDVVSPEELFGPVFSAVQLNGLFEDSKTFADATPKLPVEQIRSEYESFHKATDFDLRAFVMERFTLPTIAGEDDVAAAHPSADAEIRRLWDQLSRKDTQQVAGSSLIHLPNSYAIAGGRFREVYYWDSYFAMLGLAQHRLYDRVENTVENFAFLIREVGFVPNGNRTYYCTRSQPPYFSLMVELLANVKNDEAVLLRYLPELEAEYAFWMKGSGSFDTAEKVRNRVVSAAGGFLNRYWDNASTPRAEGYREDVASSLASKQSPATLFRDIRAACESGWDFSSRWCLDETDATLPTTTEIIPVCLNSLLYHLEKTLSRAHELAGDTAQAETFERLAQRRAQLIRTLFFDEDLSAFSDIRIDNYRSTKKLTLACVYPLFVGIASAEQAAATSERVRADLLQDGGWLTTLIESGQQWDAPNGWAPLQWLAYRGLLNYGLEDHAVRGASNWVENNLDAFRHTQCFHEKYNVVSPGQEGHGGEYQSQQGFGWTNGVLIKLMHELGIDDVVADFDGEKQEPLS